MSFQNEIYAELTHRGADFVHFVDISRLSSHQNKNYPHAVLIGKILSPQLIKKISTTPDYVSQLVESGKIEKDEFYNVEQKTDGLADFLARFISESGYKAFSQSEARLVSAGHYDGKTSSTPLPHKTIALIAGLGWIGKHNLLVTEEFGSAFSMCTVLTNAPLKSVLQQPLTPKCDECHICADSCPTGALAGKTWTKELSRDELINVSSCTTCLRCLALCPFTRNYMSKNSVI